VAIVSYSINDYWGLFYLCLYISLVTIGLVTIVGYSTGDYWWLVEGKLP